ARRILSPLSAMNLALSSAMANRIEEAQAISGDFSAASALGARAGIAAERRNSASASTNPAADRPLRLPSGRKRNGGFIVLLLFIGAGGVSGNYAESIGVESRAAKGEGSRNL
ncbi:MAG: hypothetical protein K8F57_04495, partial [Alphaproteobacteria bacterium]|nr:hypothetical protein [Alphaproteobacteria bacterium]